MSAVAPVLVDPAQFADDMKLHLQRIQSRSVWTNPLFHRLWCSLCDTFNRAATGSAEKVMVIPACLGSGKSEGLKLYLSKLVDDDTHPGALVVVELRETATQMAADINQMADRTVAVAFHGDSDHTDKATLRNFPVLIICHAAFALANDHLSRGNAKASNWRYFISRGDEGQRKLIVVDEAPNFLREAQVNYASVSSIHGILRGWMGPVDNPRFESVRPQMSALAYVVRRFERLMDQYGSKTTLAQDGTAVMPQFKDLDMAPLIELLPTVPGGSIGVPLHGGDERRDWEQEVTAALSEIPWLLRQFQWYEKAGSDYYLHTGRCILPDELLTNGFVILDGTARGDVRYEMLGERVEIIDVPNPRTYRNVRLIVAIVPDGVGKWATAGRAEEEAPFYLSRLQHAMRSLPTDTFPVVLSPLSNDPATRQVFLLTNKDSEPAFRSETAQPVADEFKSLSVAWYGMTGGSNNWADYDTCAIYGLQYPPAPLPVNQANAKTVQTSTYWLNAGPGASRRRGQVSHIWTTLAQGIGRVRDRIVVNAEGDCQETDVFLLLSDDGRGICKDVLTKLYASMPGLRQHVVWDYREDAQADFTPLLRDALIDACLVAVAPGQTVEGSVVWTLTKFSKSQKRNRIEQMKTPTSIVAQCLAEHGFTYKPAGRGKGQLDTFARTIKKGIAS